MILSWLICNNSSLNWRWMGSSHHHHPDYIFPTRPSKLLIAQHWPGHFVNISPKIQQWELNLVFQICSLLFANNKIILFLQSDTAFFGGLCVFVFAQCWLTFTYHDSQRFPVSFGQQLRINFCNSSPHPKRLFYPWAPNREVKLQIEAPGNTNCKTQTRSNL